MRFFCKDCCLLGNLDPLWLHPVPHVFMTKPRVPHSVCCYQLSLWLICKDANFMPRALTAHFCTSGASNRSLVIVHRNHIVRPFCWPGTAAELCCYLVNPKWTNRSAVYPIYIGHIEGHVYRAKYLQKICTQLYHILYLYVYIQSFQISTPSASLMPDDSSISNASNTQIHELALFHVMIFVQGDAWMIYVTTLHTPGM